jgi:cobalt-zinc-cadmium efflux system outer membrane protein
MAGFLLLGAATGASAQDWTEPAILDLFDRQNPIRREIQAAAAATVEGLRIRTLWPNPAATYSRETVGFTEFVQAEQQLPVSGRLGLARQTLDPARESVQAQGEGRLWDIRASLRAAFYRALAAQEQAALIRSALAEIGQILDLLRVREREGEGSTYDRMRVERETAELRADQAIALARARNERTFLLSYLPPQTDIGTLRGDLGSRSVALSRAEVVQRALNTRAEIRAEASRLAQLGFEQQAADRLRIPEPILIAGLKRVEVLDARRDAGAVVGVSVPLPLFNRGKTEVARLAAEKERAEARRELLAQQIAAAVGGAWDVYAARVAALEAFQRETSDSGAELLRIASVGYREGELGILQLLDAYRVARQTALRRLELQAAVKETEIELSRSAGFEVTQ